MTLETAISRFRQRQADLFRDEAAITRAVAGGSFNESTGTWTPAAATQIYTGPCLIRGFSWEGTDVIVGGDEVRLRRVRAKFPVDTDVRYDDMIVPTVSSYDASLVGKSFRVTDLIRDGWQICRVVIAEEVTE